MRIKEIALAAALLSMVACREVIIEESRDFTRDGTEFSRSYGGIHNTYPETVPPMLSAPKGYETCYLSHYGRHGSRFIHKEEQYDIVRDALTSAHEGGWLTEEGEMVFARFSNIYPALAGRSGELTPVGQRQHREIAGRMVRNFPGLFKAGSKVIVRTTNLERTMLSMNAALNRICELRPGIEMDVDGSCTEMNYLNPQSSSNPLYSNQDMVWRSSQAPWYAPLKEYAKTRIDCRDFASRLFTDVDKAAGCVDLYELEKQLFYFTVHLKGCGFSRECFSGLFHEAELEELGRIEPAEFYYMKGSYPSELARGDESGESLLTDFIEKTEVDLTEGVSARLRFGHDGCMASLWTLMQIPGWYEIATEVEDVWKVWNTEELPMAANIQMVFYRPKKGGEPIFRYMVNEKAWALPLPEFFPDAADQTCRHLYRWSDFVAKYRPIAEAAHEIMAGTTYPPISY